MATTWIVRGAVCFALFLHPVSATMATAEDGRAVRGSSMERLEERVKNDGKLVIHVMVPLCDNDQVDCGSNLAGQTANLEHNLYWGAIFGQKKFFSRRASGFELLGVTKGKGEHLERAAYRRHIDGSPWGRTGEVELIVVFDAFRGDEIDAVVDRFFEEAGGGGRVTFVADGAMRTENVSVVGYAGHNRMMDGKLAPPLDKAKPRSPIPSFVMACYSRSYFDSALRARGSETLIMTKQLMAPEGYVIEAIVGGVGAKLSREALRQRTIAAYAKWQNIDQKAASTIFD